MQIAVCDPSRNFAVIVSIHILIRVFAKLRSHYYSNATPTALERCEIHCEISRPLRLYSSVISEIAKLRSHCSYSERPTTNRSVRAIAKFRGHCRSDMKRVNIINLYV